MTEEQWGQMWAAQAYREGHRPTLPGVVGGTPEEHKERARKKHGDGVTVEKLRELAAKDLYVSEAARTLGISRSTASYLSKKHGIPFRRGNTMEGRRD